MIFQRPALLGIGQEQAGADKRTHLLARSDYLVPKRQRFP